MNEVRQPRPEPPELGPVAGVKRPLLWFALVGGAVAWTAHLLGAYAVSEFGCVAGLGEQRMLGINGVAWILLIFSVLTLAAGAAATVASYRVRRQMRGGTGEADADDNNDDDEVSADAFISRFGVLANSIFTGVILVESVPIFYFLGNC